MRARVLAVFAALIATTVFTNAATISKKKIDAWTLTAHTDSSRGAFSHCAATAVYTKGTALAFSMDKTSRWRFGLINKKWKLTKGAVYPIHYRIDQGARTKANALVRTTTMVSVELTKSDALFRAFQRGYVLTIEAAGERFVFSLKSSSKALAATRACVRSRIVKVQRNPFAAVSSTKRANSDAKVDTELRAEATTLAANLLSAVGIEGFRIVDELPRNFAFKVAWKAPGLLGGIAIKKTVAPDTIVPALTAASAKRCEGEFASMKLPFTGTGTGASLKTACVDASGKSETTIYIVLPRPKGGTYVVVLIDVADGLPSGEGGGRSASEAAGKLMDADIKLLSRH